MARRRDPKFETGHLCRFCGKPVPWGTILRLLRVDSDQPLYMQKESACHTECLRGVLRPEVPLTLHRHWNGTEARRIGLLARLGDGRARADGSTPSTGRPPPDDSTDIDGRPCAMCARDIAPAELVRLRVQRPAGTVKAPQFDEQTLPLHFECLAAVSTSRLF